MKTTTGAVFVLAAGLALGAANLDAQQGRRSGGMTAQRDGAGPGIEAIMRMQEELELTEEQLRQLDALRQTSVARRTAWMTRLAELRSQLAAGRIQRSDVMAALEDHRAESEGIAEAHRSQIEAVLTEAQRESVVELRQRGSAFRAGRAAGMRRGGGQGFDRGRGPAARGDRGPRGQRAPAFRGRRGPGNGPALERRGPGGGFRGMMHRRGR